MNNVFLMGALSVAILTGAGLAHAQEDGKPPRGPQFSFEEVDTNADGKLTKDEMRDHRRIQFMKMDTDGDGQVSEAEMREGMQAKSADRIEKRISHMMKRHDANGDNQLSPDEIKPKRMGKMFDRADTDGDGAISRAEFDEMKAKRAKNKADKG
ncbi:EF-hand domain-containing protein [Roseovarius sp. 2305UL8-3]|uniref:EF-hand domain-containing protein n=1 Tax=Roseovarius conchicola TaxID=3121636 RepID=UPI0035278008